MATYIIPDQFHLDHDMSLFVAKKYLKESVYRSAHLEGLAVTFPQTEAIIDNLSVADVPPRDISKVCDLRDAWAFVLSHLSTPVDLQFLQNLHAIIARDDLPWDALGRLRTSSVRITGTSFIPPIPTATSLSHDLASLQSSPHQTDRAITVALHIMRTQPFLDGNKRLGTLVANRLLVASGRGIFSVPATEAVNFSTQLVAFYESGDPTDIKKFISTHCLTGITQPTSP